MDGIARLLRCLVSPGTEIHKSIGIILFIFLLVRVVWRFISPPPPPLTSYSRLTHYSAVAVHVMLYLILFTILISGYLISTAEGKPISVFGLFEVPALVSGAGEQADLVTIFTCGSPGALCCSPLRMPPPR